MIRFLRIEMKKIVVFFLVLAVFSILSARSKFNEDTIKAELRKPGVKLVAIDFYMTGCPPCDAAIPEWKKLKKQYGDALKLIVVAPMQDNGNCVVKDWRPDKMVCDEDMEIAGSWGVKDFPQAFLYSWHNNDPLVQLGHVKDVEKAIKAYFKEIPRVVLDADSASRNLVPKVEEALRMNSKIELVSSAAEQKQLLALKKQSHQLNYDEDLKCELGKEISANSVLKITKEDGDLVLRLSSVEKSCTMAAATKSLSGDKEKLKTEVAAAVYELLSQMFGNISTPDEGAKPAEAQMPVAQNINSPDLKACEYARSEKSLETWNEYLESFPNGECLLEAKNKIRKLTKEKFTKDRERVLEMYSKGQINDAIKTIAKISETECGCEEDEKILALKKQLLKLNRAREQIIKGVEEKNFSLMLNGIKTAKALDESIVNGGTELSQKLDKYMKTAMEMKKTKGRELMLFMKPVMKNIEEYKADKIIADIEAIDTPKFNLVSYKFLSKADLKAFGKCGSNPKCWSEKASDQPFQYVLLSLFDKNKKECVVRFLVIDIKNEEISDDITATLDSSDEITSQFLLRQIKKLNF